MSSETNTRLHSLQMWRIGHLACFLCTVLASMAAFKTFKEMDNKVQKYAFRKCIFYAKPQTFLSSKSSPSGGKACLIDLTTSQWGSPADCNFVSFAILASFVYAIIALWFFVQCSPAKSDDGGREQSWRMVLPSTVLCTFMLILTFAMAWIVTGGLLTFFNNLQDAQRHNCTQSDGIANWDEDMIAVHNQRVFVELFGWLIVVFWLLAEIALILRCALGIDFPVESEGFRPPTPQCLDPLPNTRTTTDIQQPAGQSSILDATTERGSGSPTLQVRDQHTVQRV
ncbi:uncharacterized protein LOC135365798 isoform X2 [Ornithodoros turicata]|uniref:uncharacterized protein LOC135365798 isoform X2 n=1 Tax=Ornithodoros turicata TaxID=34597 RepID=UPI0031389436